MSRPSPELRRCCPLNRRTAGSWGENLALRYLQQRGFMLVERNYRTRYGEIDLVVRDGDSLVFVEVKLRRGESFGAPVEAVTPGKQAAIRSLAEQYLSECNQDFGELRFDVVGILAAGGPPEIVHVRDAF